MLLEYIKSYKELCTLKCLRTLFYIQTVQVKSHAIQYTSSFASIFRTCVYRHPFYGYEYISSDGLENGQTLCCPSNKLRK